MPQAPTSKLPRSAVTTSPPVNPAIASLGKPRPLAGSIPMAHGSGWAL